MSLLDNVAKKAGEELKKQMKKDKGHHKKKKGLEKIAEKELKKRLKF